MKMMFTKFLVPFSIAGCLLIFAYELNAQAYDFKNLSVSEGLPHGQITDIYQSNDGFMWLGTAATGVVRFDGQEFKSYGRTAGLKDDMVTNLFEDSKRNLWVSTYNGGVAKMDGDTFIYPFIGYELNEAYVTSILEAPDGNIWFSTYEKGIFIFDGENLRQISQTDGLISNSVWDIYWDPDGTVWIATHEGLSIFDGESFQNYTTEDGISGSKLFKIVDHNGVKWFATNRGITTFDGEQFDTVTEVQGRQLHYVFDLIKASDGKIWIGMENDGVFWYDQGEFIHITRSDGLASNYIYTFFEDLNNNVWIGTDERGISIYRGDDLRFYNSSNGLTSNEVLSLFRDRDEVIWIGTVSGLQSYNGSSFTEYNLPTEMGINNQIWDIDQLANGNLIFVENNSTLIEFDGNTFVDYSKKMGIEDWYIYDIKVDRNGILWIGSDTGLLRFDGENLQQFGIEDGLPGPVIYHIYESHEEQIWVATNSGVGYKSGDQFSSIRLNDGLPHYNVNYITQDPSGGFWFGTSAGVTHYLPGGENRSPSIRNFGKEEGMALIETLFLWFDNQGNLWQGTNGGLHHLNVSEYRETGQMFIEHYSFSDQGIGVETTHKANITDSSGRAWFGTMNGIIILDGNGFKQNASSPNLYIEDILLNGNEIDWEIFSDSLQIINGRPLFPSLDFPYDNYSITFSLLGLEYRYPENLQYRYTLEGIDEKWNQLENTRTVKYTNLDPGDYRFIAQARTGMGTWSSETVQYSFSIAHPYWQRAWFWALIFAGFGLAVYGFIRLRVRNIERAHLTRLVDEKTRHLKNALTEKEVLLKEVHHRVKNNLAVIHGLLELQSDISLGEADQSILLESKLRVRSIALVHEKIYQNENLSRIEASKYIPELTNVIIDSLHTSDKNIDLHLDIDDVELSLDQGVPCGLILNELISNIYKHAFTDAEKGNVWIQFKLENNKIVLKVEDDGKGLPDGFEIGDTNSLGLILVKTLSAQIKADLNIHSDSNGTRFDIVFEQDQKENLY